MFAIKADCPSDELHSFATNKEADQHNIETLSALCSSLTCTTAEDYKKMSEKEEKASSFISRLKRRSAWHTDTAAVRGCACHHHKNLDIENGLFNGTFGKVLKIVTRIGKDGDPFVDLIGLQLDNPNAVYCIPAAVITVLSTPL